MRPSIFTSSRRLLHLGRVKPVVEPNVKEFLKEQSGTAKRLPTKRKYRFVELPVELEYAAIQKIKQFSTKKFRDEAKMLHKILMQHKISDDEYSLAEKKANIQQEIYLKSRKHDKDVDYNEQKFVEDEKLEKQRSEDTIEKLLFKRRRDWHFYEYDEYSSTMYMAMRLAPNFAAIKIVFDEIKALYPNFKPKTVLDFGSGMGTTSWAVHSTWPKTTNEILNIELSKDQQNLNEYLQRGGRYRGEPLQGVFHRQYLPVSDRYRYDMVVAAFSLLDLPNSNSRVNVIENLWNQTNDLLVIVEHGTRGGFQVVQEARHFILDLAGHDVTRRFDSDAEYKLQTQLVRPNAHVLAPCSHDFVCPRLTFTSKKNQDVCRFPLIYQPIEIGESKPPALKEEFSYVVLQKSKVRQPDNEDDDDDAYLIKEDEPIDGAFELASKRMPRIVERRKRGSSLVIQTLCCPNGHICTTNISKKNYGKECYKLARGSDWGDLMPIKVIDEY